MTPPVTAAKSEHDRGLVQLLGLLILLPVANALADPSTARVAGAVIGLLALVVHQVSLSRRWQVAGHVPSQVAGHVVGIALAALTVGCGIAGHALTHQPWTLVVLAAALQCAVRLDPLPLAVAAVLACTATAPLAGLTDNVSTTLALVAGPGLVAALRHRLLVTIAELRETRQQLADAAVRRERDRFSDDLHDLLGHSLSVIAVSAQVVSRVAPTDPARAAEVGGEIETHARRALDDVRAAVLGYRARTLADEAAELHRTLSIAGIAAEFDVGRELRGDVGTDVHESLDAVFALVLREAVTNVLRHSRARACRATVSRSGDVVMLCVVDDGCADATAAARAEAGLTTVRGRLAPLGGRLTALPVTPHGLRLEVEVPLATRTTA